MAQKHVALSLFWRTFFLLAILLAGGVFAWTQTFRAMEFEPRAVQAAQQIALTTGEFSMLKALVRHPRQPLSRDKLAQLARGREFEPFDRSLDVQISRLRKMIEPDPTQPRYIQTVWGVGYVFVPDGAA